MAFSKQPDATASDASLQPFLLWMLAALRLRVERADSDVFLVRAPAELGPRLARFDAARFTFSAAAAARTDVELATTESPLFRDAVAQLQQNGPVVYAVPVRQPTSVHELTPILFGAYTVDGGQVHLGGCSLEDVPLLRVTIPASGDDRVRHVFIDTDGRAVDETLCRELELAELLAATRLTHRSSDQEVESWRKIADPIVRGPTNEAPMWSLLTAVWCKFASGKLVFTIGGNTAELAFEGWAQQLARGSRKPPLFPCAATSQTSFHLAATDDGRITAAEIIARCAESGRRVLASELVTCAATGKQALPEFFEHCPVTETRVLRSALVVCAMCRQTVSPTALRSGRCGACRSLQSIRKEDPRLARLLDVYPKLDRWPNWQLAETTQVYVLIGHGWVNRLLLVLDKESLEPLHLAAGVRLLNRWSELEQPQWNEYLG